MSNRFTRNRTIKPSFKNADWLRVGTIASNVIQLHTPENTADAAGINGYAVACDSDS